MRFFIVLIIGLLLLSCSEKKPSEIGDTPFQIKMNRDFKDASKSPLKRKDLKNFAALDFFPYDERYKVDAVLERKPNAIWFNMKTNTERLSRERVFAIATFELLGKIYKLNIYQGEENMATEGYEDYLFLPFLDNTNGETTYGGGRYIDLKISEGNTIEIDFNKAYNPTCAYDEKFSCPLVPRINSLNLNIEVGVKAFSK
jgi:hypothetical protein